MVCPKIAGLPIIAYNRTHCHCCAVVRVVGSIAIEIHEYVKGIGWGLTHVECQQAIGGVTTAIMPNNVYVPISTIACC